MCQTELLSPVTFRLHTFHTQRETTRGQMSHCAPACSVKTRCDKCGSSFTNRTFPFSEIFPTLSLLPVPTRRGALGFSDSACRRGDSSVQEMGEVCGVRS